MRVAGGKWGTKGTLDGRARGCHGPCAVFPAAHRQGGALVREPWEPECKYFIVNQKKKQNIKRKKCYYRNGFTWKRLKKRRRREEKKKKKKAPSDVLQPFTVSMPTTCRANSAPMGRVCVPSPARAGTKPLCHGHGFTCTATSPPPVPPQGHGTVPTGRSAGSCSARVATGHSGGGEGQPLQAPSQPLRGGTPW